MNEFINAHGDQIFNIVFIGLMVVVFIVGIYAWRKIGKDHKAYVDYIKRTQPNGRLVVRGDQVVFVENQPNTSPVDPNT